MPLFAQTGPTLLGFVIETTIILTVLALAAFAAARLLGPRWRERQTTRRLRLVETLRLGPRRQLALVELDGREIVVATSEGAVTIHEPARPKAEEPR